MGGHSDKVAAHYGSVTPTGAEFAARILKAFHAEQGASVQATIDGLAPYDHFHIRGHVATRELIELARPAPAARVLDVGSGIGGPARLLAAEVGCAVTGLDLTPMFCAAARVLTDTVGLADRVRFVCGSALDLPFGDGTFDLVWTQHMGMNIQDKPRLYAELARVLVPGGRLVLHDVVIGPTPGGPDFPVCWSSTPETSFLATPSELRALLQGAGLRQLLFRDMSVEARAWAERRRAEAEAGASDHRGYMGPEFAAMARNVGRGLMQQRIGVIEAIFERPA
jgi:SAM-dependent methyltransferase